MLPADLLVAYDLQKVTVTPEQAETAAPVLET